MNDFETCIVFNDTHFPKQNKRAIGCLLEVIEFIKPQRIVMMGDIMSCDTFSRHDIDKAPKSHWTEDDFYIHSKIEYDETASFLNDINRLVPRAQKIYLLGNHEMWLENWIKRSPQTRRGNFGLKERLPLRGYSVLPHNNFYHIGKLRATHGLFISKNHSRKHVMEMGKSVIYGHTHDSESSSKVNPESEAHMAWSNACLCDMNPDYMVNRPNNWNHGFAIIYVWKNSDFQVDIKRIHHGKVIVHGKEFK